MQPENFSKFFSSKSKVYGSGQIPMKNFLNIFLRFSGLSIGPKGKKVVLLF
jgi:hypothetical protein